MTKTAADVGIISYRDLASIAVAIERDLAHASVPSPTEEAGAAQRRHRRHRRLLSLRQDMGRGDRGG
jgi:hypothetical protein